MPTNLTPDREQGAYDTSPEPVLPQELIDVYEQFEQLFGEEDLIYPNSVDAGELMRREQMCGSNDAEPDLSDVSSRFTKVTVGDMYASNKSGTPTRKAPPELNVEFSPNRLVPSKSSLVPAIPGLFETLDGPDHQDAVQQAPVDSGQTHLGAESSTYQVKSMLIYSNEDAKERKRKKKEKKLQNRQKLPSLRPPKLLDFQAPFYHSIYLPSYRFMGVVSSTRIE